MIALVGWGLAMGAGCVEPVPAVPNSDGGEFFVDNDLAVARGWKSAIALVGPETGKQHCDRTTGICYADHHPIEMVDVISEDPSIVEVVEFGDQELGEVKGGRVLLEGIEEGIVKLEAQVKIKDEVVVDTFDVRVAPVASIELFRRIGGAAPYSRHGFCSNEIEGVYLFDGVDGIELDLFMYKKDEKGNLLRGFGQFPLLVEPDGAAEFSDGEEGLHLIRMAPKQMGRIMIASELGGPLVRFHFARQSDIDGGLATIFSRDAQGQRLAEVGELVQGQLYDFVVYPLIGQAPLCGGDAQVTKQNLTPANCSFAGAVHGGSDQAVVATQPGECHIVFTLAGANGGRGLRYDYRVDIIPGEYAGDPGW